MFAGGMMLGNRRRFDVFINASRTTPWVLSVEAPQVYIGAPVYIALTVSPGVEVRSDTNATAALVVSGLQSGSEILLTNGGFLVGLGGELGTDTGTAIYGPGTGCRLQLVNAAGRIWGAGGAAIELVGGTVGYTGVGDIRGTVS